MYSFLAMLLSVYHHVTNCYPSHIAALGFRGLFCRLLFLLTLLPNLALDLANQLVT